MTGPRNYGFSVSFGVEILFIEECNAMNKLVCAAILATALISMPTFASDVVPANARIQVEPREIKGQALDLLGIVPGMTVQDFERRMNAHNIPGRIEREEGSVGGTINGVQIRTVSFVQRLLFTTQLTDKNNVSDHVNAVFSTPASGNRIMSLRRELNYHNAVEAPMFDEFLASIRNKFGNPSGQRNLAISQGVELMYVFQAGRIMPCQQMAGGSCPELSTIYSMQDLELFERASAIADYQINIIMQRNPQGRMNSLQMSVVDIGMRHRAMAADVAAIMDHVNNRLANAKPTSAPRL